MSTHSLTAGHRADADHAGVGPRAGVRQCSAKSLLALGAWGERWVELRDEHTNPRFLLWTWFADQPQRGRAIWLVVRPADAEVCTKSPGDDDDLVVQTTTMTLAKWHTRQLEWADAQRPGQIRVTGPHALARMLPTGIARATDTLERSSPAAREQTSATS